MLVFGIGCIFFGYISKDGCIPECVQNRDEFLADIQARLEKVESLSAVKIEGLSQPPYGALTTIREEDGEIIVPMAHGGVHLSFDLYIPFRVQEQVFEKCDVETFQVNVVYGYEMPVTVISYDFPNEEGYARPSLSVALVRKFLEGKLSDSVFRCGSVGPSPFHADFNVIETSLNEGAYLKDCSVNQTGYANIELRVPPDTPLIRAFYQANLDTLFSQFYFLSELRSRILYTQSVIVESSRALLQTPEQKGLFNRLSLWREQARLVDVINNEVFQELLLRLEMGNSIAEADNTAILGTGKDINRFFTEYRTMSSEERWSRFTDVAKFFEERRQKMVGNVTAIVAGVIGGVVGSAIGAVGTYLLTSAG